MDYEGIYWRGVRELARFLGDYRQEYSTNKKYKELERALAFVLFLTEQHKTDYLIGFPSVKTLSIPKPLHIPLKTVIDLELADDRDVDVIIAPKESVKDKKHHRLQLTSFIRQENPTTESLFSFIVKKKFVIPRDDTLILLIFLEQEFKFNYIEFSNLLKDIEVPYGQIFILRTEKPRGIVNMFCIQVYPMIQKLGQLSFKPKDRRHISP